jgi:hypothetical protein
LSEEEEIEVGIGAVVLVNVDAEVESEIGAVVCVVVEASEVVFV